MTSFISPDYQCDVLIIGSGAAGLSLALRLATHHDVIVLSKTQVHEGSTFYAQGGIAAVFDETDNVESHVNDTLKVGAGLCEYDVVSFVASNARHCVQWLIDRGVAFDRDPRNKENLCYHLTRESGHSHRRILHSADATGRAIETTLVNQALNNAGIHIIEHVNAIDLILSDSLGLSGPRRVTGAWIWNENLKRVETCSARAVVLATGGAAKVYQYTTNPDVASGDGIAMAWRVGCRVANLEFNQFHPTSLFHPNARNFLLTEALRGEGAWLLRPDGTRFMHEFDVRAELAPRDIVARVIDHEMKRLNIDYLYLDISHQPPALVHTHFPTIYEKLLFFGFDLTRDRIPIVPAAHYTCGGVMVDTHGRTDVDGLYAIGEVSYTGLHGANRMASNSLLECIVYGWSASEDLIQVLPYIKAVNALPIWNEGCFEDADQCTLIQENWHELRPLMWDCVGIVRTTQQLERALCSINLLQQKIDDYYATSRISNNLLEQRNLTQVAGLMVRCAQARKESRGLHFIRDYPGSLSEAQPTILIPPSYIKR